MAKSDEILAEVKKLKSWLYGADGHEGDIPEIKAHLAKLNEHQVGQSTRLSIVETLMSERTRPSKKIMASYISGVIAIGVALWKAFNNQN